MRVVDERTHAVLVALSPIEDEVRNLRGWGNIIECCRGNLDELSVDAVCIIGGTIYDIGERIEACFVRSRDAAKGSGE